MIAATPRQAFPWYRVPYLHGVMPPNQAYAGGAITTDDLGLRTVAIDGRVLGFREFQRLPWRKKLLIGGSTAFSMGSSSAETTIASSLSRLTGDRWFHLACPGYVSPQELMLYCLTNPANIDDIVFLSGLNNLSACLLDSPSSLHDVFSPNFFVVPGRTTGMSRTVLQHARRSVRNLLRLAPRPIRPRRADPDRMQLAVAATRRDLEIFCAIARARNITITFLAQPLLPLLKKPLAPEEVEILEIQQELGQYEDFSLWGICFTILPELYREFCGQLEAVCRALGIRYVDLNQAETGLTGPEWLFCDQMHFTDQGAEVCAEYIAGLFKERRS